MLQQLVVPRFVAPMGGKVTSLVICHLLDHPVGVVSCVPKSRKCCCGPGGSSCCLHVCLLGCPIFCRFLDLQRLKNKS